MRFSRLPLFIAAAAVAAAGLVACKSDGRTLRPATPDQDQSVYTTSTTVASTAAFSNATASNAGAGGLGSSDLGGSIAIGGTPGSSADSAALPFILNLPFQDGGAIDAKFTCNGLDVHPQVSWLGAPAAAVEMALVVRDTDASDFVHWIIAGLDPKNPLVPEGTVPVGAVESLNGFSTAAKPSVGWKGPCPPAGAVHHYEFTLYALDQQIELPSGSSAADLQAAIDASAIQATSLTGVYPGP